MKIIISESQHRRLFEEEQKVLHIPDLKIFGNDWDVLQRFLESKGYPLYSLGGNLNLVGLNVESLGNLSFVGGSLVLSGTALRNDSYPLNLNSLQIRQTVDVQGSILF